MFSSRCLQFVGSLAVASSLSLAAPFAAGAYYVEARPMGGDGGADLPIAWPTDAPVEWRFADPDLPDGVSASAAASAIDAAFQAWGGVECSTLAFTRGDDEAMPRYDFYMDSLLPDGMPNPAYEPRIIVFFSADATIWTALSSSSDARAVGLSFFAFDEMGRLNGATIMLNSLDYMWSAGATGEAGKFDIQNTVTTLIGRSLGLYSTDATASLYPRYRQNDIEKRSLEEEDQNAVRFIYNDTADASCMAPPAPEMICLGMLRTPGCPPPVMGMPPGPDGGTPTPPPPPGDGGVTPPPPPADSGTTMRDSGTTPPGGDDDDDGCSCSVPGAKTDARNPMGALATLGLGLAAALFVFARRRS